MPPDRGGREAGIALWLWIGARLSSSPKWTWLLALSDKEFGRAQFYIDLLEREGPQLGEPYTRQLRGKLRELRFYLQRERVRITYYLVAGRRIILLTVFKRAGREKLARSNVQSAQCGAALNRATHRRKQMASRVTWSDLKKHRRGGSQLRDGYVAAQAGYRLAERVRTLREHRGVSQQELADRIGSTQSAVSRLESGGAEPSLTTLERIGRALNAELVVEFADVLQKPKPSPIARAKRTVHRIVMRSPRRSFAKKSARKR